MPVARLDRHRGADGAVDVAEPLLDPLLLARLRCRERGDPLGALARVMEIRQRSARLGRVGLDDIGKRGGRNVGQRAQGQAIADRAVAGNQVERAAAGLPFLTAPAMRVRLCLPALDRQHVSGRLGQTARENAGDPVALLRVLELGVLRRDVRRQVRLFHDPLGRVFVGRRDVVGGDAELGGDRAEQRLRLLARSPGFDTLNRDAFWVLPDRLAVAAPIERKGPARQGLAGIPFALPVMQEPARREAVAQAPNEAVGERALGRADGVGVPLARFEIIDRDEGRLAAHGEPDVVGDQLPVDLLAESVERFPGLFRIGLGDARMLGDPLDAHVELEIDVGETREARDRRGVAIVRRRGERNMAFPREEARGWIEPDPAGARKIDLGPSVEVGEVAVGARRTVQGDEIRLELDQIAGHEAGGEAEIAEDLDQEPARIAARAGRVLQRLLRALHPRLHANEIFDLARKAAVEINHEIDGSLGRPVDSVQKRLEARPRRLRRAIDDEVGPQVFAVFERPNLRALLNEKVERVVDRHVGDDVDFDLQFVDQFGEDVAGEPVAVGVLLVVHEMVGRRHFQGMRDDPGPAVRRGPEADDLRAERDRPVIFIVCQVMDGGSDRHGPTGAVWGGMEDPFTICCAAQSPRL